MTVLQSEYDRVVKHNTQLTEALENVVYCMARIGPPPYGHKCMWCGDCVKRAKDDARAALYKHEGVTK